MLVDKLNTRSFHFLSSSSSSSPSVFFVVGPHLFACITHLNDSHTRRTPSQCVRGEGGGVKERFFSGVHSSTLFMWHINVYLCVKLVHTTGRSTHTPHINRVHATYPMRNYHRSIVSCCHAAHVCMDFVRIEQRDWLLSFIGLESLIRKPYGDIDRRSISATKYNTVHTLN